MAFTAQDIVNAIQTAQTLLYSGIWNPSITSTPAVKGTLFLGTGSTFGGMLWQKQDDGDTTNWKIVSEGAMPNPPSQTFTVDPVNGDDATGNPYRTIGAAAAAAAAFVGPNPGTGSPTFPTACILCLPGNYTEAAPTIPYNVSLMGYGFDCTVIENGLNYTSTANGAGRTDITGIKVTGPTNFDTHLALNDNLRCINSRFNTMNWNGGSTATTANNLLTHGCVFGQLNIIDGATHLYDNHSVLSGIDIAAGSAGSNPYLEICGGLVQGAVTMEGGSQCYARGVLWIASLAGTIAAGLTPQFSTDKSSLPTTDDGGPGTVTGTLQFIVDDNKVVAITSAQSPYNVTTESLIYADPTAGAIVINLQKNVNRQGFPLTVVKTATTPNAVTLTPAAGETVGGNPTLALSQKGESATVAGEPGGGTDTGVISRSGNVFSLVSQASAGGAALQVMGVPGLLASDQVLSVTQQTPGANPVGAPVAYGGPGAGSINVTWTADPGAGAVVRVAIVRQ